MGVKEIKKRAVVAVVRGATLETIIPMAEALKEGGVTALEITMETPKALALIEKAADVFGDDILVGAGTVWMLRQQDLRSWLDQSLFSHQPLMRKRSK